MPTSARRLPKYRNKKTLVNGILFDSMLEAKRWGELILLSRAGEIANLERQVKFVMRVNDVHVCTAVVDFGYTDNATGKMVLEDTKSPATAKERSYRIKKKLLYATTGHEILEIFK